MATGLYSRPLMSSNFSVHSIDARGLSATDGLLLLVTRSLDKLKAGEILEILSDNPSAEHDLTAWSRLTANRWIGTTTSNGRKSHRIEKGSSLRVLTDR
ncbi:MAG: hypothetical protein DMG11_06475 [Acidobacteria bacterium]|nr:MAG: hypothetical protein DMG11_06475 [Acidobacteriota bacterium]